MSSLRSLRQEITTPGLLAISLQLREWRLERLLSGANEPEISLFRASFALVKIREPGPRILMRVEGPRR